MIKKAVTLFSTRRSGMVKRIAGAILGCILAAVVFIPSTALVAPIDGMLRLSTLGGAERENVYRPDSTAGGAHGIFNGEALAVIPTFFLPPLGIQFAGDIVAANAGWRAGVNGGAGGACGVGKARLDRES